MAQILSIYGIVVSVIIANSLKEKTPLYTGVMQFAAGLAVGLCGLAAGFAIGIVGDSGGASRRKHMTQAEGAQMAHGRYSLTSLVLLQFVPVPSNRDCTLAWC